MNTITAEPITADDLAQALAQMIQVAETFQWLAYSTEYRHPNVPLTPREAIVKAQAVALLAEYRKQK